MKRELIYDLYLNEMRGKESFRTEETQDVNKSPISDTLTAFGIQKKKYETEHTLKKGENNQ